LIAPEYRKDGSILRFDANGPVVLTPTQCGKLAVMHREFVENFLDHAHIPWSIDRKRNPYTSVLTEDGFGAVVVWPFILTGPLPNAVMTTCSHGGVRRSLRSTDTIVYGG